ncbi:MAG: hypothetical protein ACC628_20620, partial [Pirellulaceae bacterium]
KGSGTFFGQRVLSQATRTRRKMSQTPTRERLPGSSGVTARTMPTALHRAQQVIGCNEVSDKGISMENALSFAGECAGPRNKAARNKWLRKPAFWQHTCFVCNDGLHDGLHDGVHWNAIHKLHLRKSLCVLRDRIG